MTVLFWADAAPGADPARLRRARALACALAARGVRCRFALPPEAETIAWLAAAGLPTTVVLPDREPELRGVLRAAAGVAAVIVDVTRPLEVLETRALRAGGRVLVAVDNPGLGALDADLVVVPFGEPYGERRLAGPAHAPLEPLPAVRRRGAAGARAVVFVDLEGASAEALLPAVEALARIPAARIRARVVANPAAAVWARLPALLGRLDFAPAYPARAGAFGAHLTAADVAVLGFGPCVHEALAAGVPSLVLCTRRDEVVAAATLAARSALVHLGPGWTAADVAHAVRELISDPAERARMAGAGQALVDARGAERVAARVLALLAGGEVERSVGRLGA